MLKRFRTSLRFVSSIERILLAVFVVVVVADLCAISAKNYFGMGFLTGVVDTLNIVVAAISVVTLYVGHHKVQLTLPKSRATHD